MAYGALFIAPFADKVGKKFILLTLTIESFAMISYAFIQNMSQLGHLCFSTGLGINGMIATLNTLVCEY